MTSLLLLATPFLIQARMPLALLASRAHTGSCSAAVTSTPRSLSPWALSCHTIPSLYQEVIMAKMQDSALGLIKPHPIGFHPSIQPFQVSLQSPPTFQQCDTRSQLNVICKFTNNRLNTLIHVINKINKNIEPLMLTFIES
ncbi:hypothetical protein HGM15179_007895 [Zosterops borbonicus]|uniref:Uncharacterized protein n=1 Tax=Zosterops borbonicus TaxID=364589 RepID=A0A8K1GJM0_9PASS|nr:hypothetical protein HGM15179_007895 [Zosterops borbonicus]